MNTFVAMDKIMYSVYVKKIMVNYDNRKNIPFKTHKIFT